MELKEKVLAKANIPTDPELVNENDEDQPRCCCVIRILVVGGEGCNVHRRSMT